MISLNKIFFSKLKVYMRFSIALYFFLFFQLISYSQSVLVPAGNNSLSPGPSLNWTIGEGITELRFDTKASISGEFQQSIITSGQSLSVSVSGITIIRILPLSS